MDRDLMRKRIGTWPEVSVLTRLSFLVGFVGLLVAVPIGPLTAQQELPIEPGDRLRITSPTFSTEVRGGLRSHSDNERPLIGVLRSEQPSALTLAASRDSLISIPMSAVQLIEKDVGKKKDRGKGAQIGLAIGAGVGALMAAAAASGEGYLCEGCWVGALLVGAGAGAGMGAALGVGTTAWKQVYPEPER
jgi:hypothetical protein